MTTSGNLLEILAPTYLELARKNTIQGIIDMIRNIGETQRKNSERFATKMSELLPKYRATLDNLKKHG